MEPSDMTNGQNEAVDLHQTHSFEWCLHGKQPTSVTCNKAGTVEDVLRRQSSQFRTIEAKIKDKELVFVRDGKSISPHFPCCLIGNERITVRRINTGKKQMQCGKSMISRNRPSTELITFNVRTKGGNKVKRILTNQAVATLLEEITIYAYKGEKVKQALRRDGRILSTVFQKNCALCHVSAEINTEMSNLVDDLDGQTYRIILLDKSVPDSQVSSSLEEDYEAQIERNRHDSDENHNPPQPDETKSGGEKIRQKDHSVNQVQDTDLRDTAGMIESPAKETKFHQIPNSEELANKLCEQFRESVKGMKTGGSKLSRIQNLFRVQYNNSDQIFKEVKTMKKLMTLSRHVCQVRINGHPQGSGFLLFGRFVLTNAHVLKDAYDANGFRRDLMVTVHFSFESVDQSEGVQDSGAEIKVEEVAGIERFLDVSKHEHDWALLKLSANHELHSGLLNQFAFLPASGEICIIGHPDGGVKKLDSCLIIQPKEREQVIENYFNIITCNFFENASKFVKRNDTFTYEPCFSYGSSGSPVFDKYCKVIAMHSGGFVDEKKKNRSVIEFGYPLSSIIEHIIVQMVQNRRFDVLKAYLAFKYSHHEDIMHNVKKLVESRNITAFKDALSSSEVKNDESLKMFFTFFSLKNEPVPMDIDNM